MVLGTCPGRVGPGTGYPWLAKGTAALRFPVCQDQSPTFDSLFQDLAADIIDSTLRWCELELPEAPTYNIDWMGLRYTPDGGQTEQWSQLPSLAACGSDDQGWAIADGLIKLCPSTCTKVDGGPVGQLDVHIPCGSDG